jgi:hypothetical protein
MQVNTFGHGDPRSEPPALTRRPRACRRPMRCTPGETSHCQHPKPPAVGQSRVFDHRLPSNDQFYSFLAGVRAQVIHFVATRKLSASALRITSVRSLGSSFGPAANVAAIMRTPPPTNPHGTHQNLTWTSWFQHQRQVMRTHSFRIGVCTQIPAIHLILCKRKLWKCARSPLGRSSNPRLRVLVPKQRREIFSICAVGIGFE